LHGLTLALATPVVRILRLDPAPLVRAVAARQALRDHAFEPELAHGVEEGGAVSERLSDDGHGRTEGKPNESGTTLLKGRVHHVLAVHPQHVERDERDRDGRIAVEHARAHVREVGIAVSPGDEFAVEQQLALAAMGTRISSLTAAVAGPDL
jgi:hypothetical protein